MRVVLFNVLFFGGTFMTALTALMLGVGPGGQARVRWCLKFQGRWVQAAVRHVLKGEIEIRGLEHIASETPAIIAPKHQSELDVFIPLAMYPDIAAIAMAELARYPLLGPVLRKLDYVLVSVEGQRKNQLDEVLSGARRVNGQGRPILIYPEGELMRLGSRERYKHGVYHIYKTLGAPVVPVAQSLGLIWPQREWKKNIGKTGVWEFLEPIPPGLDKRTFMIELERRIEHGTMELIREHGDAHVVAEAERRFALGLNNSDAPPVRKPTDLGERLVSRAGSRNTTFEAAPESSSEPSLEAPALEREAGSGP